MAPAATSCHACGKVVGKLLLCGRCRNAWFCSRDCQIVARKVLGHRGANCRAVDGTQSPTVSAAPSQPPTPMDRVKLRQCYVDLIGEAYTAGRANTRIGNLAGAEKFKEATSVAALIGGAQGAALRADVGQALSICLSHLNDMPAAAKAACSSLRAARESGNWTALVSALSACGDTARAAPGEMVSAERESREQERLSTSPSYGGLNLSQAGQISLPTTTAALSRLGLAYNEAAVAICDAALTRGGGCGSPTINSDSRKLLVEARARGFLGFCLYEMREDRQRSWKLIRQAVALRRRLLRAAAPGVPTLDAQRMLAEELSDMGLVLTAPGSDKMAEAEACLREALALGEGLGHAFVTDKTLRYLINICGEEHAAVGPAEAEAFRLRLNQLLVQMGRSPETSCSICLEPLAPPADGAAEDAAGSGGSGSAGGPPDLCVRVLACRHSFHHGCLATWGRTATSHACPICRGS